MYINSYFDSNNYTTPILDFIERKIDDYINIGYAKSFDFFVIQNFAELSDNHFSFIENKVTYEYIAVDRFSRYFTISDDFLMRFEFYLDAKTEIHSRTTLTILDIIGIAGGFASIVSLLASMGVAIMNEILYNYHMISNLYQIDASLTQEESQSVDKNSSFMNLPSSSFRNPNDLKINDVDADFEEQKIGKNQASVNSSNFHDATYLQTDMNLSQNSFDETIIRNARRNLEERKTFNFSYRLC